MLDRELLRDKILEHLEGHLTLEDLAAWAEEVFREEEFDPESADQLEEILSVLREATDPHRFRWEEPDFDEILQELEG